MVLGPWLILMGLFWPGWLRMLFKDLSFRGRRATGSWGAFALGVPFAIAICPVCTPALIVLLGVVAGIGSPLWSASLLLACALGRAVPVATGADAVGGLEKLRPPGRYQHAFDIAAGVALVVMGLYMLNAYFFFVTALAA